MMNSNSTGNDQVAPPIIQHYKLFPVKLKHCSVKQLLSIVDSESSDQYREKLHKIITTNKIDGKYFENMTNEQFKELMNLKGKWCVSYITDPIHNYFKNIIIPINEMSNNESRHIVEIDKNNNDTKSFTINKSYKGPLIFAPPILIKYLSNILNNNYGFNIPIQIIEIIVLFCLLNESIIALSFSLSPLNESNMKETYQYLSKMSNKLKDIRSLPASKIEWDLSDENSDTIYGKVCDIIDPSLFVKCIHENKYQWIPSIIQVMDETLCKIKIISSINRFKNDEKNKKLFEIYENIISLMLPHFEDVTQNKLIKNGNKLQIICKAIEYDMCGGSCYGTEWHYEGIKEIEHICAVGIFYTFNELDDCGMLEFSVDTEEISKNQFRWDILLDDNNNSNTKVKTGKGNHFGIETNSGKCIVWNNYELQHRLGFIENNDGNDKKRQAIICMLIEPKHKIQNENENDFNITLNDAKERREKVKQLRTANQTRELPYCFDCGSYGHWNNGPGGFPSEPTPIKIVNLE